MTNIIIDKIVSSIGTKIAQLRRQKRMSVNKLAQRAGISGTAVHKLENNQMTPTVTLLMKIADALETKIVYFLEEKTDQFDYVENIEYNTKSGAVTFQNKKRDSLKAKYVAFRLKGGILFAILIDTLKFGETSGVKPVSHPGEALVYCLEGEVTYKFEDKSYCLKKGDSLHYFTRIPHRWEVTGRKGVKTLWIITPPPVGAATELWK
jgi:transcriptional regulator with XRE-family HTH domain